jgi:hypothetical protein
MSLISGPPSVNFTGGGSTGFCPFQLIRPASIASSEMATSISVLRRLTGWMVVQGSRVNQHQGTALENRHLGGDLGVCLQLGQVFRLAAGLLTVAMAQEVLMDGFPVACPGESPTQHADPKPPQQCHGHHRQEQHLQALNLLKVHDSLGRHQAAAGRSTCVA